MDPIERALDLLPAWVRWGPLVFYPLVAAVASLGVTSLGVRLATGRLRGLAAAHWTERARHAMGARIGIGLVTMFVPVALGACAILFEPARRDGVSGALSVVAAGVAALVGAIPARRRAKRTMLRELGPAVFRKRLWVFLLVMYPHLFVLLVAIAGLAAASGVSLALGGVALVLALVAISAGVAFDLARALGLARPASPRLARIVAETAARLGVRAPEVYELRTGAANALAFPLRHRVAFTDALLDALDDDQLAAVTAHELGHLSEPRSIGLVRAIGVSAIALVAFIGPVTVAFGWPAGVMLLLVYLLVVRLVRRVGRAMETRADAVAHRHGDGDTAVYASALERLYEMNMMPAVMGRRAGTHPDLWDRMLAAGVTPSYPKPAPPERGRAMRVALLPVAVAFGLVLALRIALIFAAVNTSTEPGLLAVLTLTGCDAGDWAELGDYRSSAGDVEAAATMHEAASEALPDDADYALAASVAAARAERCADARRLLDRASASGPFESQDVARQWLAWCDARTATARAAGGFGELGAP